MFIVLSCNKICAAEILTSKTPIYCIMGNDFNILVHTYSNYMHVDIREDVGNRAKRAEFDAAVRRRHMVTKQDIANIRLMVKDMAVIRNKDDAMSVDLFVQELQGEPYDLILLYKRQHEVNQQLPSLTQDVFLLAIQTEFQKQLYQEHAHKVLCVDAMHGTNAYRFKLITVMVADDYGQGKQTTINTFLTNHVINRIPSCMVYL